MALLATHIRPSSTLSSGYLNTTSPATNLSDNSSATYVTPVSAAFNGSASMALTDPSLTLTSKFIYSVRALAMVGISGYTGSCSVSLRTNSVSSSNSTISTGFNTYASFTISNIVRVVTTGATTVTATGHTFTAGQTVLITGNTSHTWANGTWVITSVATNTFTFTHPETTAVTSAASNGTAYRVQLIGTPLYVDPSGAYWTSTSINDMSMTLTMTWSGYPVTTPPRAYEAFAEVMVYDNASMTISSIGNDVAAPFTNITDTSKPVINWTYSQTQNLPQTGAVLKLFSSGFAGDPETATPIWSKTISGVATTATVDIDLGASTSYELYYKVATGSNYTLNYSSWASVTITMFLTVPTAPTVTAATWSTSTEKATITVTGTAFASGSQSFTLERSDDSGTTWYVVRGASGGNTTAATVTPSTWTVYDYEPARNKTVQYRASSTGVVGTSVRKSAYSSTRNMAVAAVTTWSMFSVTSTVAGTYQYIGAPIYIESDVDIEENVGVYRPLGSTKSVVIHGVLSGQDGTYRFVVDSTTKRDTLLSLVNSQQTICVVSPLNEIKYVRIVGRHFTLAGISNAPTYSFEIQYVEVASGLTAV